MGYILFFGFLSNFKLKILYMPLRIYSGIRGDQGGPQMGVYAPCFFTSWLCAYAATTPSTSAFPSCDPSSPSSSLPPHTQSRVRGRHPGSYSCPCSSALQWQIRVVQVRYNICDVLCITYYIWHCFFKCCYNVCLLRHHIFLLEVLVSVRTTKLPAM